LEELLLLHKINNANQGLKYWECKASGQDFVSVVDLDIGRWIIDVWMLDIVP
jgi:hypothetical protein